MRDQTAREPKFPAACARCGGRISEPVTFCPHCGAHARFALAGDAPHAGETAHADQAGHASQAGHAGRARHEPHGAAAFARPASTVPPYDFEGDLDPPWPGPPTPLFASPDGDPYGQVHAPGLRGERQWGLKWGTALVVGAFVILYGGAVAVHRYDGVLPLPQSSSSSSKSAEGAIASNGGGSNFAAPSSGSPSSPSSNSNGSGSNSNALQAPAPVADNAAPAADANVARTQPNGSPPASVQSNTLPPNATGSNGTTPYGSAANDAVRNSAPSVPRSDDSRSSETSIASLPPPAATAQQPPNAAPAQAQPQTQPQAPANPAPESRAAARARSHTQSAAVRSFGDAAVAADAAGRQSRRSQSQPREPAQFGRAAAARAVETAQVQLAKSDLRGARGSLARALAADPSNGDALSLRDQLVAREQERDASLSAAHACVVQSRWNCVWHNAGKALAVDASSTEAKALVDRAIVESGAATTPAGPGPDNVEVPMVQ